MSNYWQPNIDKWIPESFAGNTERVQEPHQYTPPISDYAGTPNSAYASESEEMKIRVDGFGDLTIKEIRGKIVEILEDIINAVENEDNTEADALEHKLFKSPELENLVKQYVKHAKLLRASKTETGE